jgi:polyisoprenoid-binding protein YceI
MKISAKVTLLAAAAILFGVFTGTAHAAEQDQQVAWNIVKEHSSVGFAVKHLMVSKVRGVFRNFSGTVKADKDGRVSYVEGTVKTASVDTGVEKRDNHLRAPDFFDSAKFPDMTARTNKITWNGDKFTAETELTIKGITKTVVLNGEYSGSHVVNMGQGDTRFAGYTLSAVINRKDFGLNFNAIVNGTIVVDDKVELNGELEIASPVK